MGSTIYGLPKGVATALNEIARNTKTGAGRNKVYRTEEDYYQAMIESDKRINPPKDPMRLRLWKRANARWSKERKDANRKQLNTLSDMICFLQIPGNSHTPSVLKMRVGKDYGRNQMADEAIRIYNILNWGLQSQS